VYSELSEVTEGMLMTVCVCVCVSVLSGRFAAGDKVTYSGSELVCHWCVLAAAAGAPERPTHVPAVQSVATRPQGIPVGDQLHSPDSDFSTPGKRYAAAATLTAIPCCIRDRGRGYITVQPPSVCTVVSMRRLQQKRFLCLQCVDTVGWASGRASGL